MASQFMIRNDCLKRLRELCENDHWKTAFALGQACQLLSLEDLNEVVEAVGLWSGDIDGAKTLPDPRDW